MLKGRVALGAVADAVAAAPCGWSLGRRAAFASRLQAEAVLHHALVGTVWLVLTWSAAPAGDSKAAPAIGWQAGHSRQPRALRARAARPVVAFLAAPLPLDAHAAEADAAVLDELVLVADV